MNVLKKIITLGIIHLVISPAAARSDTLQLMPPAQLKEVGVYDGIPEARREQVVFSQEGKYPAGQLLYVLPMSYGDVVKAVREVVARQTGGVEVKEQMIDVYQPRGEADSLFESSPGVTKTNYARLKALGIPEGRKISETVMRSQRYNEDIEKDQHSVAHIKIVDASLIFRHACALMAIGRVDHSQERLRTFHLGIPIGGKGVSEISLVTDTELAYIKGFEREIGFALSSPSIIGGASVVESDPGSPWYYASYLEKLKPQVEERCKKLSDEQ